MGHNALHWTAIRGDYDMAELLVFMGADVYAMDDLNRDAEDIAISYQHDSIAKLIGDKKEKKDIQFNMWKIRQYDRDCRQQMFIKGNYYKYINN